ncbi:WSC domain-containing protein [Podospora fimiseda]|uniref:WSC domain-containing protein n=1 Tax=Podospora fimiseda TaxID=252190 RepID=A0AAN7BJL5_9PEZI|nr:WSC domain-containing protein [Podospora fimiseda]
MKSILALAATLPAVLAQTYYGCYTDYPGHALTEHSYWDNENMTATFCQTECLTVDPTFTIWGTQYGEECYCGHSLPQGVFPAWEAGCNVPCKGDPAEMCGGNLRLSLYGTEEVAPAVVPYPHSPAVTAYSYVGCYSEIDRTLPAKQGWSNTGMTIYTCGQFCKESGYLVFGLEYSEECWCGDEIDETSVDLGDEVCDFPCSGAPTEVCGGSNKLSIYQWA